MHIHIFRDDDMAEAENDPRTLTDYRAMWDRALKHEETLRKIRNVLNDLTITSTAARIRGATLEIHEILEGAGF